MFHWKNNFIVMNMLFDVDKNQKSFFFFQLIRHSDQSRSKLLSNSNELYFVLWNYEQFEYLIVVLD